MSDSLEAHLSSLPAAARAEVDRILYGCNMGETVRTLPITQQAADIAAKKNFEIAAYQFRAAAEQTRAPRIVRIGAIQNKIVLPTTAPVRDQWLAICNRVAEMLEAAFEMGVNIACFQEAFHMPFAFCTREKQPWCEFATPANGELIKIFQDLAKKYNMVLIVPILERDLEHQGVIHNAVVVISNNGGIIGKNRKNHIPRVGDFNEATYYVESELGHPVFETAFGKIAINICYGRHHPLNWLAYSLNGAEIVFNPSATVGELSEPLWGVEARNAAIANNYFTVAINRVGTEHFAHEFTSANGKKAHTDFGPFYGSSYVAGPDASRCPGLSRNQDGLLVTEVDLNLNQQMKDVWTYQMAARYPMYRDLLKEYCDPAFKPQVIRDPSLK